MKNFKRFLVIGEKNIFGMLSQIITIAAEANQTLTNMLDDHKNGITLERGLQTLKGLENKADQVAFRVNESITAGAVSPNILDNLLECVRVADDIVDTYFYQSRELTRMHKAKFPYSEETKDAQWIAIFKNMLELSKQSLTKVQQILITVDLRQNFELRKEIEVLEQKGDEIKDKSFDILYQEAPRMHYLQFYHYSELLHKFDDILDYCEDLSDLVLSIITSILK
ncbi:MAG: DUF47 family protein [Nitrososphaerota archaeon]|nr:DUF47 family protein [Nitrososphaerota archaeon]